jgi:hypothetical protein
MSKSLLVLFSLCFFISFSKAQSVKDDTIKVMVQVSQNQIENLALFERFCYKLPGVKIDTYCSNHAVYFISAPRNKYISEFDLFSRLKDGLPDTDLYLKTGSQAQILNDCEPLPQADAVKLNKLINEN